MRDPFEVARLAALVRPVCAHIGLTTLPQHVHEVAASYALFSVFFRHASPLVSARLFPRTYARLDAKARVGWDTRMTSQVFQVLVLGLVVAGLSSPGRHGPDGVGRDWATRLWGYDGLTGLVQALAAGYFLWDAQVSARYVKMLGADSLAHAVGWLVITMMGFRPFANYYGLNFMLYELSTPFLNNHWFLDKLGMTGSRQQLINGILLLATFGLARLVWGSYQSVRLFHDVWDAVRHVAPADAAAKCAAARAAGLAVPLECNVLPTWLAMTYVGGTSVLTILNFWWFNKMMAAVRKRFRPKQADAKQGGRAAEPEADEEIIKKKK